MFAAYEGDVRREADLVCYWFAQARQRLECGRCARAGLVATNSIRGGANRKVLDDIAAAGLVLFDAWDDEPWVVDGADVRVSLVCFGRPDMIGEADLRLDGVRVSAVNTDLTGRGDTGLDLTRARPLRENRGVAFMGDTKGGAFDVPGDIARQWLLAPVNPNRRPNSDVLRPWVNGLDITRRGRDMWIIDFGWLRTKEEVAYFELPYSWAVKNVWPDKQSNRRDTYRQLW